MFDWLAFLEWEETKLTMDQQYLAQIAEQVAKGRAGKRSDLKAIKRSQFILKVVSSSAQERMSRSKHAWAMFAALNKGRVNKKVPGKKTIAVAPSSKVPTKLRPKKKK